MSSYGTIIQIGTTCKKISTWMHDSGCRWRLVEKVEIFQSYVTAAHGCLHPLYLSNFDEIGTVIP